MVGTVIRQFSAAVSHRIRYRYGLPFVTAVVLALVTIGRLQPTRATSIWTFALLVLIATAFALLYGSRFRTLYVAIAVTPPFLFVLQWFLKMRSWMSDFPSKPVAEYFLYFIAAPIFVVWTVSTVMSRLKRHA